MNKRCALVTGPSGFVGLSLIPRLSEEFDKVVAVYHNDPLPYKISNVSQVSCDLSSFEQIGEIISNEKPSVIYNLSGILSDECMRDPIRCFNVNVFGTQNLLELSRRNDVELLVQMSSLSIFQKGMKEPVNDDSPLLLPKEPYGASKLYTEALSNAYYYTYGLDTVCLRYAWIYGPGRKRGGTSFASKFIEDAYYKGEFTLPKATGDWIYIKDVINSLLLVTNSSRKRRSYIIKGDTKKTEDAYKILLKYLPNAKGKMIALEGDSPATNWVERVDDKAARLELGWTPEFSLEKGISDFISYLRNSIN